MPSAFPGMNPYLEKEAYWDDFHQTFIPVARGMLTEQLPAGFFIRISNRREAHSYLRLHNGDEERPVTVIDLLGKADRRLGHTDALLGPELRVSPSNSLVEIDLLRRERSLPPPIPSCDYLVLVDRAERRPLCHLWPIPLRQRLPVVPIPLHPEQDDLILDLQEVLNEVYDSAGYAPLLYETPPEPPLSEADREWAQQFISAK